MAFEFIGSLVWTMARCSIN